MAEKPEFCESTNMQGLISYQEGAVVSRTLLDKESGTVTLFAFGAGQGLSEHTAPFDALVLVLDGAAEVTLAGMQQLLKAGDFIIMPANEPHALRAVEQFKMMLIMLRAEE
jgi:quercetin dioxygenase-like cupin family protein